MVMEHGVFEYLSVDERCVMEQEPMEKMAHDSRLGIYKHDGFWQCMDTQRDRSQLEAVWNKGSAPWAPWLRGEAE